MFKTLAAAALSVIPVSRAVAAQDARSGVIMGITHKDKWTNRWTHGEVTFDLGKTPPLTRTVWSGSEYRPITSDDEWSAQGWADDPMIITWTRRSE